MAKKAKGKKHDYLPKRIAGMKVPKGLRRGRLGRFLASPEGEALAASLIAAAAPRLLKKGHVGRRTRRFLTDPIGGLRGAGGQAKHAGEGAVHEVGVVGGAVSYAIGEAARAFLHALENPPEGPVETTDNPKAAFPGEADPERKTGKKKRDDSLAH
jgi:hypothetical protein